MSLAPPTDVTVVPGVAQATVSWTASTSQVTGYKIFSIPDNKLPNLAGPSATSLVVTKLKNGIPHSFRVHALNGTDMSASSTPVVPGPPPAAPKVVAVRGTAGSVVVTMTGKPQKGSTLLYYNISVSPESSATIPTNINVNGAGVGTATLVGLDLGTSYTVSATVTGPTGTSTPGAAKPVIPADVPEAPVLEGLSGVKSIQLSWITPINKGSPVLGYIITYRIGEGNPIVIRVKTVNLQMIKSLVTGTAYTLSIQATNAVGNSVPSNSLTLTPT